MISPTLLAQTLPSASSGVDWLYQFTNNLSNLTTQNGGALTQLGLTELSCIALFTLISMVINWNTSGMTLRFHTHPNLGATNFFVVPGLIGAIDRTAIPAPVERTANRRRHEAVVRPFSDAADERVRLRPDR